MSDEHRYTAHISWTGNNGSGTSSYEAYERAHEITLGPGLMIPGSSDPAFRGDGARANPEQLLLASISSCHMLWFLHLCADVGIIVLAYEDEARGLMAVDASGAGRFERVDLAPRVELQNADDEARAGDLHTQAHDKCFIANSVNFPVHVAGQFTHKQGW
jgi:organic hydroperoxide reductase OsmC/OhrA